MILRVYRARATTDSRSPLFAHLRDVVYPANVGTPGLRTFQAGVRDLPDGLLELTLVSTWTDVAGMVEAIGADPIRPAWLDPVASFLTPVSADHYELVGEQLRGIVPLAGGALRILTGRLNPNGGEGFFEHARTWQAEQLDSGLILVSHIGRRLTDNGEEAVYVAVWRDTDAPSEAGGSATEPVSLTEWGPFFESWSFAAYDAIARVPGRRGSDQVLLLADDDRCYLYASPATSTLLGRAPARVLGLRVEDLVAPSVRDQIPARWAEFLLRGTERAQIELERPDGTPVLLSYEARSNAPWRGVHASALAPSSKRADLTEALAAAGIIAWYDVSDVDALAS